MAKHWKIPKIKEVVLKEDSTSSDCQGKRIGCYAGSSCGSVKIKSKQKGSKNK